MKSVTTKVVFDRKGVADNSKKRGLVQVEVLYDRKQLFISTGIKIYKNQWDIKNMRVKQSLNMVDYNNTINSLLGRVQSFYSYCLDSSTEFTFDGLKLALNNKIDDDFLGFIVERIKNRGDLRNSSKNAQMSGFETLKEFGRIKRFQDITLENIMLYDDYLHGLGLKQTTIWGKHKVVKTYINEALKFDRIKDNPYRKFKVNRGEARQNMYVDEKDILKLMDCSTLPEYLQRVRDLIIVQFYSGMAVSDLMAFDCSKLEEFQGQQVLIGKRKKTGITYTAVIFNIVKDILEKYHGKLPVISQQRYNSYMKLCFLYAGINLPNVSSHWLRRGFGMWALNNGAPIEVVSKALGHSNIATTEKSYAKVKYKTVVEAITKIKR